MRRRRPITACSCSRTAAASEAMPWIERAAERGDPRAQYVLGTALFNGDVVARDLPRAYALMSRAAAQNLPPAVTQLAEMDRLLSPQDRARGVELARDMRHRAAAGADRRRPPSPAARPGRATRRAEAADAVRARRRSAAAATATAAARRRARAARRAAVAAAGGRWRVQLGAFSNEANARRAWGAVAGRLPGLQPVIMSAPAIVIRLQAGPLARPRRRAQRACARRRQACFPVAP